MADEISKGFDLETQLIKGKDGVFEVTFDDELVYSKKETGRFPEPGEVEGSIRQRMAD